jgi:hypothetical protein
VIPDDPGLSLENIADGAVVEQFAIELQNVLRNIADPNTRALFKREITMKVVFIPNEDRDLISMGVQCTSKLAPPKAIAATVAMSIRGSLVSASEIKPPKQLTFIESLKEN